MCSQPRQVRRGGDKTMTQTTEELLLGGHVQHKDFATLIKAFKIPDPHDTATLMLLEMQPRFVVKPEQRQNLLLFSELNAEADFAAYTATPYTVGRIFHIHGELRWERQHAHIQVVYTGD